MNKDTYLIHAYMPVSLLLKYPVQSLLPVSYESRNLLTPSQNPAFGLFYQNGSLHYHCRRSHSYWDRAITRSSLKPLRFPSQRIFRQIAR